MGASCVKNRRGVPVAFSLQICIVFSLRQSSAYLTPASVRCLVVPKPGTCFHLCTVTETQKKNALRKKNHTTTLFQEIIIYQGNQDTGLIAQLTPALSLSLSPSLTLYTIYVD